MPRKRRYDKNFNESGAHTLDREIRQRWEQSHKNTSTFTENPNREVPPLVMQSARMGTNFQHNFMMLLALIGDYAYLRIVPARDEVEYHWYIKYTSGIWAGHYLYFYQREMDSPVLAVTVLEQRFEEVQQGIRKPTKDSAFGRS